MMRQFGAIAFVVVLSACSTPGMHETNLMKSRVASATEGADCAQLRDNMKSALQARNREKAKGAATMAARVGGHAVTAFVPGVGLIGSAVSIGAGATTFSAGMQRAEPDYLYQESHSAYHKKGCTPKIKYGQ